MIVATAGVAFEDNISSDICYSQELPVEHIFLAIRQQVSALFADGDADYSRIFTHILRYAQVEQSGKMAIIIIPNQWKLHQQDSAWPCCYATLNTFIRLLCALGILRKIPRRKHRVTAYHLPLMGYVVPPDAFTALDVMIDPARTKTKKFEGWQRK